MAPLTSLPVGMALCWWASTSVFAAMGQSSVAIGADGSLELQGVNTPQRSLVRNAAMVETLPGTLLQADTSVHSEKVKSAAHSGPSCDLAFLPSNGTFNDTKNKFVEQCEIGNHSVFLCSAVAEDLFQGYTLTDLFLKTPESHFCTSLIDIVTTHKDWLDNQIEEEEARSLNQIEEEDEDEESSSMLARQAGRKSGSSLDDAVSAKPQEGYTP